MNKTNKLLLSKTITWRIISVLSTGVIVYLCTGNLQLSSSIAVVDFIIKTILYVIHEKYWMIKFKNSKHKNTIKVE